jgi:hypothetical protein
LGRQHFPVRIEPLEPRLLFSLITALGSFESNGAAGAPPAGRISIRFHAAGLNDNPPAGYTLFGTTTSGGSSGDGTLWQGPGSPSTTLVSFNGADGADPATGAIIDPVSNDFVGTTLSGGPANDGVIFDFNGINLILRATFTGASGNGSAPSGLVADSSGDLFGIAHLGAGTLNIFELAHGSSAITTLATLSGQFNGSNLIIDGSGNLYGALSAGAGGGHGSVFELVNGASSVTTLATFSTADAPYLDLAMDGSGNLFGATIGNGRSTIFEVAQGSGVVSTLTVLSAGMQATGGLAIDPSGNLFGSATGGAAGVNGIVFELVSGSGTITTLASFNGTNGTAPAEPILGGAADLGGGNDLFGVTTSGGAFGSGAIWGLNLTVPAGSLSISSPANAIDGIPLKPSVAVTMFDELNNEMESSGNVTIGLTPGASNLLTGTLTQPFVSGVATFSDLAFNSIQGMQQLTATTTAAGNPTGTSSDIQIAFASNSIQLAFVQQPATVVAGLPINPPVVLNVEDLSGNIISGPVTVVTLSLLSNSATLTEGVLGANPSGVDVFSDLVVNTPGTYQILAIGGGAEAISSSFTVLPAGSSNPASAKLAFVAAPAIAAINQPLSYSVAVEDGAGNLVSTDNTAVLLSIGGPDPVGPLTANAVNGIATFSGVSFNALGVYSAVASDGSLTEAFSSLLVTGAAAVPRFQFSGIPLSPEGIAFAEARNLARETGQPVVFDPSAIFAVSSAFGVAGNSFSAAASPLPADQIGGSFNMISDSGDPTQSAIDSIDKLQSDN